MVSSKLFQIFLSQNFLPNFWIQTKITKFPPKSSEDSFGFLPNSSGLPSYFYGFFSKLFPLFPESYFWICWPNLIVVPRVPPNFLANFLFSNFRIFPKKNSRFFQQWKHGGVCSARSSGCLSLTRAMSGEFWGSLQSQSGWIIISAISKFFLGIEY